MYRRKNAIKIIRKKVLIFQNWFEIMVLSELTFTQGLRSENPSSIATALQVFYNLDCLGKSVNDIFNDICVNAEKSIQEAVDIRLLADNSSNKIGGPGKANLNIGNQEGFQKLFSPDQTFDIFNIFSE